MTGGSPSLTCLDLLAMTGPSSISPLHPHPLDYPSVSFTLYITGGADLPVGGHEIEQPHQVGDGAYAGQG